MKKTSCITEFIIALICTNMISCASVKQYQKVYLNDEDMKLQARAIEMFETNFESYREGSSGANGGKSGGGCGCN